MAELLIVLALVLLNGFFAMSEMSVMTSRKSRLKQLAQASRRAAKALALSEKPEAFLSTVQIGITLIGILTGLFGLCDEMGDSVALDRRCRFDTRLLVSVEDGLIEAAAEELTHGLSVSLVFWRDLHLVLGLVDALLEADLSID